MTSSSFTRDHCFHGELSQLIWDTPKISSDCSNTNCSDRTSALKWDFPQYFWWNVNVWVILSPEVRSDFQIWFSPGFPMQSRQARSDPSHGVVRPNSSSASILLWPFLHLHLLAFFSTSLQDYWWNWNGWCWTNTKDDSIHHVWNVPWSVCLRVGSWCQCIWFGSWGPNWFYQITNQEQLCGFWKHVSL